MRPKFLANSAAFGDPRYDDTRSIQSSGEGDVIVDSFLEQLYADGCRNDKTATNRDEMMLNITPFTGVFLDLMIRESKPTRILELGTSNGYSTIWLARAAARVGAEVDTVDSCASKLRDAKANLEACSLDDKVRFHHCDGGSFLSQCNDDQFDFVFLDSDRSQYPLWCGDLIRVLRFGLLVVDNAISHTNQLDEFRNQLTGFGLSIAVLPIGKGQMVVQAARR